MYVYVDVTPVYNLGQTGSLDILECLEGALVIPDAVVDEVTVEPAATNLEIYLENTDVSGPDVSAWVDTAQGLLGSREPASDVALVAGLLRGHERDQQVALVSDDRRLRAVAEGLGATVTGTFGVITRASVDDKYFSTSQAKRLVRRTDHHGVQMTGRLRERAVGEL